MPTPLDIILEVEQHMGEGRVKCVAMQPTECMVRGMKVEDKGEPITVPVGRATLGRVMNVIGGDADNLGPIISDTHFPIHRPAPKLEDQNTSTEMFETGLKVVDLWNPTSRAARRASSGAPVSAKPSSSWN